MMVKKPTGVLRTELQQLRRDRKAALREGGRLGEKLHTARLEIEHLRNQVKGLEHKLSAEIEQPQVDD